MVMIYTIPLSLDRVLSHISSLSLSWYVPVTLFRDFR